MYAKIVITLSWDVHPHPGPLNVIDRGYSAGYFAFCNWNVNTLSKNDLHHSLKVATLCLAMA